MKKLMCIVLSTVLIAALLVGCGTKSNESEYKEGTYEVEAENFDEHGWKSQLELEIKDGKIAEAKFDYVNEEGNLKTEDENYNTMMKEASGTNPAEFSPELSKRLIDAQDIEKVDVVTGATVSSDEFKKLANVALENAESGKTELTVAKFEEKE